MADGLLSSALGAIDRQKQAAKSSIGLLASNPQEWLTQTTARYLPTRAEEQQYRAVQQAGGDITQTPYYQKLFDLAQFQSSIKTPKVASGVKPPAEAEANKEKFLESSAIKERLYHGTQAHDDYADEAGQAFEQFASRPTWLAKEPYTASGYSAGKGTTYPVYAQIKNPLILRFDANESAEKAFSSAKHLGVDVEYIKSSLNPKKAWEVINHPSYIDAVEKAGHDAILINEGGYKTYGVFDPRKIKSAIGNRGTYDVTNPNILAAGIPIGLLGSTQVELPKKQEKKPKK